MTKPRKPIVLIDDNHDDLFILKRLLIRTGTAHAIVTFDHAVEAKSFLEAAVRTPEANLIPAAIFSDKVMPELSGLDLLQWVRGQPALNQLPFVLLTSAPSPRDDEAARRLGVTAYFEKFPPQHVFADLLSDNAVGDDQRS